MSFVVYKLPGNCAVYDFTSVVPSKRKQMASDHAQLIESQDTVIKSH
jgi:hypothetical protein